MVATIINQEKFEEIDASWKTYYLKILADNSEFYKFGVCGGSIRKRYSREPESTVIEVIEVWPHKTEGKALTHERKLFKTYPGVRPYIGKCGPFKYGGNTETYCHDVLGGEAPPDTYIVQMVSHENGQIYTQAFCNENPLSTYKHLGGQYKYMAYAFGPEYNSECSYLQVADLSNESAVVLATEDYLNDIVEGRTWHSRKLSRGVANDALRENILVTEWSDYMFMRFRGDGFKASRHCEWV